MLIRNALSPVTFPLLAATQLYDDATLLVRPKFKVAPLHIVLVAALVILGLELTVTVVETHAVKVPSHLTFAA